MGIFDGCLLVSDVDDTLVSSGLIHPKNIEKIEYFVREGGMFSVATGRSANAVGSVTKQIKHLSPSVVANGCIIYDYKNDSILYSKIIPIEDHIILKKVMESNIDVGVEVHSGIQAFTPMRTAETDFHQSYEGFSSVFCDFETVDNVEWNKVIFLTEDIKEFEKIRKIGEEIGLKSSLISTGLTCDGIRHNFLEIVPFGISKATAISKLCEMFNIKKGCLYAIGDYYNDLPMLKNADISAVTAGAPSDVKAVADYITVSCEDGAVADFIDYLSYKILNN